MTGVIRVDHVEEDLFEVRVRDHLLWVDQPTEAGGSDAAPSPVEFFVISLAACVAFYVRRFLARHGLPTEGLEVGATYAMAERPARVNDIEISIGLPEGVPDEQRSRLLAVATHCTVHNTLETPPRVSFELESVRSEKVFA